MKPEDKLRDQTESSDSEMDDDDPDQDEQIDRPSNTEAGDSYTDP
jgi:hypothetical protein